MRGKMLGRFEKMSSSLGLRVGPVGHHCCGHDAKDEENHHNHRHHHNSLGRGGVGDDQNQK